MISIDNNPKRYGCCECGRDVIKDKINLIALYIGKHEVNLCKGCEMKLYATLHGDLLYNEDISNEDK